MNHNGIEKYEHRLHLIHQLLDDMEKKEEDIKEEKREDYVNNCSLEIFISKWYKICNNNDTEKEKNKNMMEKNSKNNNECDHNSNSIFITSKKSDNYCYCGNSERQKNDEKNNGMNNNEYNNNNYENNENEYNHIEKQNKKIATTTTANVMDRKFTMSGKWVKINNNENNTISSDDNDE